MAQFTLRDAIDRMQFSRSELARRADVSRTTALSVSEDQSRARVDTLRELALALGYDLSIELARASDPLAALAARVILGELDSHSDLGASPEELAEWVDRLGRYSGSGGDGGAPLRVIREAARVSGAQNRPGRALFAGRNDADRLVSAGRASEARWALSGSASLEAMGAGPGKTVVLWTDDIKNVSDLLVDTHRRVRLHTAADVIVAPAHPSVFASSTTFDDVNLVSPLQGVIDSVAIGGVDEEIALSIASGW